MNFYRVRLGGGAMHASQCLRDGFIGVDFGLDQNLTDHLPEDWRAFNQAFIPVLMQKFPKKTKVGAGLNCGSIWTVCRGIKTGDMAICPDEHGTFRVGEVTGGYAYHAEGPLPHRRPVRWLDRVIEKSELSQELWYSMRGPQTVVWLEKYGPEIEALLGDVPIPPKVVATTPEIEDPIAFAMEKHLEEFLVSNWAQTELAKDFQIVEEDGEIVGQQYQTDTGPLDILAVSHDRKRLLVVELKRGRASDVVMGQVLRYMGFVQSELAEEGQTVEGLIVALEDDPRLQRALQVVPTVSFRRYEVSFRLIGG